MDNASSWGPPTAGIVAVSVVGALMAVGCATVAADPPGRFLSGVAAVGLLVFGLGSWHARPRLAVTDHGLVYRGWFRSRTLTHRDIERIRITEFRRLGRKMRLLEIDTRDELIVLSRWDVGGEPLYVLDALTAAGYAGR